MADWNDLSTELNTLSVPFALRAKPVAVEAARSRLSTAQFKLYCGAHSTPR
jgi:hypothetical protein